jgi:hypothetical protein
MPGSSAEAFGRWRSRNSVTAQAFEAARASEVRESFFTRALHRVESQDAHRFVESASLPVFASREFPSDIASADARPALATTAKLRYRDACFLAPVAQR